MRGLILLSALVLGALAAPGCRRSGGDPADEVMGRVQAARDRACTCKDLDCAEAIEAKLATWRQANEARLARMTAGSAAQRRRLAALGVELSACTDRLRAAAVPIDPVPIAPSDPPPAEPPPELQLPPAPGDVEPPPRVPTPAMRHATEI